MVSKTRKTLIGCLFGCATLAAIVIIVAVSFYIWLSNPGDALEPETLIGADTQGYAAWTFSLDDPGTARLYQVFMDEVERTQDPRTVPGPLKAFVQFNNRRNREQFTRLFPITVAWAAVAGESESTEDLQVGVLSVAAVGNQLRMFDLMLRMMIDGESEPIRQVDYRDEQFYEVIEDDTSFVWFIRGGHGYLASGLRPAERVVDLLIDGPDSLHSEATRSTTTDFSAILQDLEDAPLRGGIDNESGLLSRVRENWADEGAWGSALDQVRALKFDGRFVGENDFRLSTTFVCEHSGCETTDLGEAAEELRRVLAEQALESSVAETATADGMTWQVEIRDLSAWFANKIAMGER